MELEREAAGRNFPRKPEPVLPACGASGEDPFWSEGLKSPSVECGYSLHNASQPAAAEIPGGDSLDERPDMAAGAGRETSPGLNEGKDKGENLPVEQAKPEIESAASDTFSARLRRWGFKQLVNWYPPLWGAGIRVDSIGPDFRSFEVTLKLNALNRNYVGTQYGGSLYSMCDPFYMLILMKNLGSDYVVWDKAASIQFKKPGRGPVHATFEISPEQLADIKQRVDSAGKLDEKFSIDIRDDEGQVIAQVEKVVNIRRKDRSTAKPADKPAGS